MLELRNISAVMEDYDVFLFDLWGVVVEGIHIYPGVVDSINCVIASKKKVFFVSNAPRSSIWLHSMIVSWGINATYDMVVSSGQVAIGMIQNSLPNFGIKRPVLYNLDYQVDDIVKGARCDVVDDISEANILLLTLFRDEGPDLNLNEFDDLLKAAVRCGTVNMCANPDIGIMQHGTYRYCAGYYAKKLIEFGGKVTYTGKPCKEIYNEVFLRLDNVEKHRILMIGDTFYTDIEGANEVGIASALVLTGNAKKFHADYPDMQDKLENLAIVAREHGVMPDFVIKL